MKRIPIYKFYKHKYGDELLVDVISYEKMMPDIRRTLVFSETFYSVTPDNPTGHCAYLMNIYVCPEHQGHGTGKRIVRWLVGAALSRGIKKIYLETSEAGRLLYSVLGFSDMKDMMHLSFSE